MGRVSIEEQMLSIIDSSVRVMVLSKAKTRVLTEEVIEWLISGANMGLEWDRNDSLTSNKLFCCCSNLFVV